VSFIEQRLDEIERVPEHEAEAQGIQDACIVLAGALDVFGVSFVCSELTAEGVDVRVIATDSPHFVEALDLLREIKPDQALVDVLRAHLKDRALLGGGAG
jgi:precorrin-3B methylase